MQTIIKNFILIAFSASLIYFLSSCSPDNREIELPGVNVISDINNIGKISSIAEDNDGYIWMSTYSAGLIRYNGTTYVQFSANNEPGSISSNIVNIVFVDSQGEIWVGTQKGINRYIRENHSFEDYAMDDNNNYITNIFEDSDGRIFATTRRSLFLLDKSVNVFFKKISFENATNTQVIVDNKGELWITRDNAIEHYSRNFLHVGTHVAPMPIIYSVYDGANDIFILSFPVMFKFNINDLSYSNGIPESFKAIDMTDIQYLGKLGTNMMTWITGKGHYCYNFITGEFYSEGDHDFPYKVPQKTSISFMFKDSNNNIWFGTNNGYIKSIAIDHAKNTDYNLTNYLENNDIGEIATDGRYVWVITNRTNLITYDMVNKEISSVAISKLINRTVSENKYIHIYYAQQKRFILSMDNNAYEFSVDGGKLKHEHTYFSNMLSPYLIMAVDDSGTLWTGGGNDNIQYAPRDKSKKYIRFNNFNIKNETTQIQVSAITKLRNGNIAVAYSDIGVVIINPQSMDYRNIHLPKEYKQSFSHLLLEDSQGRIWIGTIDIGLFIYDPSSDNMMQIEMFKNKNILNIKEDRNGNIFVMCESTLYLYDSNKNFIPIWTSNSDLPMNNNTLFSLPNGNIFLKANNRCFLLDLETIEQNTSSFDIIIANGRKVIDIKEVNDTKPEITKITIPYKQNNINLFLSTIDYRDYNPVKFSYKIKGIRNQEWTDLLNNPELQLHYLPYGKHRLLIRVEPSMKATNSRIYQLDTRILHPWYSSMVAKIIYILFLSASLIGVFKLIKKINNKQIEIEIANKEKSMLEKLNMENMDFFANISHEFRTPLTIISGAANSLCHDKTLTQQQSRLPRIMQRNADRMLKLVSQLLDFNKLEHDKLSLNVEITEITKLINEISDVFIFGADQKDIKLSVAACNPHTLVWVDRDKLEKIMYNLLSNALKFSPPGGQIVVDVSSVDSCFTENFFEVSTKDINSANWLMVSIADNGIGIPQDNIQRIFERFGQARTSNKTGGTGIGLYFTKSLVEVHHGFIKAQNKSTLNPTSSGSIFTFALPSDASAYSAQEQIKKEDRNESIDRTTYLSEYITDEPFEKQSLNNTILIIDDDYEIVYYLKSLLSNHYNVLASFDAMSGYKLIETENPDIIICDILMLEMDGLQLCRMVKANISMCHIPFILLTAKSTVEDQIEGLDIGADAYVVKPFNSDYLLAMIRSMLKNRDNIRLFLEKNTKIDEHTEVPMSERDKVLMNKLYKIMESSLTDPELSIQRISEELCVSRTKLYYKVKALTGKTPNEFFKIYKLNRAVELIKEDRYKISAISDMVGFSSPSHFAASFKKQFGSLPSHYIEE